MSMFTIDFFELLFLAEAYIRPNTDGRKEFWDKLVNEFYLDLTENDREHFLLLMNRSEDFKQGYQNGDPELVLFYNRFKGEK